MLSIADIQKAVSGIAPQYPIRRVYLFGSYASGKATESSDVDLLIEYSQNPVSLFDVLGFEEHMRDALKIHVDAVQYPVLRPFDPNFTTEPKVRIYDQ